MEPPHVDQKPLLVVTEEMYSYSFGEDHPWLADRTKVTIDVAQHFGLLEEFSISYPLPLDDSVLRLVHTQDYINATRAGLPNEQFGIGTQDNPANPEIAEAASRIAAGTVDAVKAVYTGRAPRAVNLSGGLHHAFASSMSGFCMYNDAAIAIQWLLDQGLERVAYVDFDAHHGDGVESIFWDDPRVLTISIHESGLYLFPNTGFAKDIGGPLAAGTAVNVALPKHASDEEWLQTIHAIVPPLLKKFKPQFVISQHGADPHRDDPLADLKISINAMARAYHSMSVWAQHFADGKWVAVGGGGYRMDSVARAWTQVLAAAANVELDPLAKMPDYWETSFGSDASRTLGDAEVSSAIGTFDPHRIVTHCPNPALIQTSGHVFPYWGLQPYG